MFAVPKNGYVDKGDRVLVDTRYGEREGVADSNDIIASEEEMDAFLTLTGATLPLRSVLGKLHPVMFEQDEKPAEEPKKTKLVFSKEKYRPHLSDGSIDAEVFDLMEKLYISDLYGREVTRDDDGELCIMTPSGREYRIKREWCEEVPC